MPWHHGARLRTTGQPAQWHRERINLSGGLSTAFIREELFTQHADQAHLLGDGTAGVGNEYDVLNPE